MPCNSSAPPLDSKYALPHYKMAQIFLKQGRMEHAEVREKFFELGQQREEELLLRQTQELLMRRAQ